MQRSASPGAVDDQQLPHSMPLTGKQRLVVFMAEGIAGAGAPDHTDADLDRLMEQAIEETKPGYRVTPGIEGTTFEL